MLAELRVGVQLHRAPDKYLEAPGNVLLPAARSGLPRDSVANVTQLVTVDERFLRERVGRLPRNLMRHVNDGLRLVLDI